MFSFNFVGKITPNLLAFFSSERLRDLSGGRGTAPATGGIAAGLAAGVFGIVATASTCFASSKAAIGLVKSVFSFASNALPFT